MAHFAQLDSNNVVLKVIVTADDVTEASLEAKYPGSTWKQTSYNKTIRGQFAGKGYTYYPEQDVFARPQLYPSWTMDANGEWQPPTPMPTDGTDTMFYEWNEENGVWDQIIIPEL